MKIDHKIFRKIKRKQTSLGLGGRAGREGGTETPIGKLRMRHLEKAKWESFDFDRGSLVERTREPSSAREEAESILSLSSADGDGGES